MSAIPAMHIIYPNQAQRPVRDGASRQWLIFACLAQIAFFVPYSTGFVAWAFRNGYFPLRPVIYLITIGLVNLALLLPKRPAFSRASIIILGLMALRLVDVIMQRWPEEDGGMDRAFRMGATLFTAGIAVISCGVSVRGITLPLRWSASVSILVSVTANLAEMMGYLKNSSVPGRSAGFLGDANDSAISIVCMLALLLSLNPRFWFNIAMIGVAFTGVLLTYSRSGFLVFMLLMAAYLALHLKKNARQVGLAVMIFAFGGICAVTYFTMGEAGKKDVNVESRLGAILGGDMKKMESAERMKDLDDGVEAAKLCPVLGYGTGAGTDQWRPHNQLVSLWIDLGLPGLIPYLSILVFLLVRCFTNPSTALLCAIPVICYFPFSQTLIDTTPYWLIALLAAVRSSRRPFDIRFLHKASPLTTLNSPTPHVA